MSIVEFDGPSSWSLDVSETGESTKCPLVGAVGSISSIVPCHPLQLPTAILYSAQFRSH